MSSSTLGVATWSALLSVLLSPTPCSAQPIDECAQLGATPAADASTAKRTGSFEYVLNGSRWSEERVVGRDEQPVPVSVLLIDVTAKNVSNDAAAVPWAHVKDAKGTSTSAVLKDYLRPCTFTPEPTQPGAARRAYFVFDVPNDQDYTLVVFGGQDEKERGTDPLELALPASR